MEDQDAEVDQLRAVIENQNARIKKFLTVQRDLIEFMESCIKTKDGTHVLGNADLFEKVKKGALDL